LHALSLSRVQRRLPEANRQRGNLQHLVLPHVGNEFFGAELDRWRDLEGLVGKNAADVGDLLQLARVDLQNMPDEGGMTAVVKLGFNGSANYRARVKHYSTNVASKEASVSMTPEQGDRYLVVNGVLQARDGLMDVNSTATTHVAMPAVMQALGVSNTQGSR